jgi:hypothetical protein
MRRQESFPDGVLVCVLCLDKSLELAILKTNSTIRKVMPNDLRRLLAPLAMMISCLIVAVLSCDDHGIVSPKPENPALKYQDEAEEIALFTAGTLRPPDWLARQVDHELQLIRTTWGDSVPQVNIGFKSPLNVGFVELKADQWLYDQILANSNSDWNALIQELNLKVHDPKYPWGGGWLYVYSNENLHPVRLAENFVGFPGVAYVSTGLGRIQGWDDFFARVPTGTGAKYFFKQCTCPDIWNALFYFEADGDTAKYVAKHYECWDTLYNVGLLRFEEVIDSIEAARPVWVDTARTHIWRLADDAGFHWSRN